MSDREPILEEIERLFNFHTEIARSVRFDRDEACTHLGKNWSNCVDIEPHDAYNISDLNDSIERLKDYDYVVALDHSDDGIVIEVSLTREAYERHQ